MASSSSKSDDDQVGENAAFQLLPGRKGKKVGRPVGAPAKTYGDTEIKSAFQCLLNECPKNHSGNEFLRRLQKAMKADAGFERTTSALQTFVKGKLRDLIPELYSRTFKGDRKPSVRQFFFLREFMKDTDWKPPHTMSSLQQEESRKTKSTKHHGHDAPTSTHMAMKKEGGTRAREGHQEFVHCTAGSSRMNDPKKGAPQFFIVKKKANDGHQVSQNEEAGPSSKEDPKIGVSQFYAKKKVNEGHQVSKTEEAGPSRLKHSPPFYKAFRPAKVSTPVFRAKHTASSLQGLVRGYVVEYLQEFKQETINEVKLACAAEHSKRLGSGGWEKEAKKRRSCKGDDDEDEWLKEIRPKEKSFQEEEEDVAVIEISDSSEDEQAEADGRDTTSSPAMDKVPENVDLTTISVEAGQMREPDPVVASGADRNEEAGVPVEVVGCGAVETAQVIEKVVTMNTVTETSTTNILQYEDESIEDQLVHVATSTEASERSRSFALTPLRAKMATVTILEVYRAEGEEEKTDEPPPFRVLEETDGTLTICHPSSVDLGEWSQEATVDHRDVTLSEEMGSVMKNDIVEACKDGQSLSPITVGKVSLSKRTFQTVTLSSKGRVVKALFKRKDR